MLRFNDYLIEQKNTHMTHVEELIFMKGVAGTRQAIEFLRDMRDALVSNSKSKVNIKALRCIERMAHINQMNWQYLHY